MHTECVANNVSARMVQMSGFLGEVGDAVCSLEEVGDAVLSGSSAGCVYATCGAGVHWWCTGALAIWDLSVAFTPTTIAVALADMTVVCMPRALHHAVACWRGCGCDCDCAGVGGGR